MSYIQRIAQASSAVEISSEELAYCARHILLPSIGTVGQRKLKAARVLVVGAGGLGCAALQALVGAGVGQITIVDGDFVEVSNLSRQWLHRHADVGLNKAISAQASLLELNPLVKIQAYGVMLTSHNASEFVGAHDLVIDATDDLNVRYWIDDACAEFDCPWIYAALYRECSQLSVFWGSCKTTFRELYPEPSEAPSCAGAGMLGATASIVGNLQALEAIKLIVGNACPKVGKLVSFDSAGVVLQSFQVLNSKQPELSLVASDGCQDGLSVDALKQAQSIHAPLQLIDLRSRLDFVAGSIVGATHCTAEQILEEGLPELGVPQVVLFCQGGSISSILVDALKNRCTGELLHLEGGYEAWVAEKVL